MNNQVLLSRLTRFRPITPCLDLNLRPDKLRESAILPEMYLMRSGNHKAPIHELIDADWSVNQTRSSQLFICDLPSQGEGF